MAGYSGTPLLKKLGLKPGAAFCTVNAPKDYLAALCPLPAGVQRIHRLRAGTDFIHFFSADQQELTRCLPEFLKHLKQDGMIWISWPKKSSGVTSTITEDVVRGIALPLGLVDVKVCAVDDVWSGLKLVIRRKNRK
jgi:hypothetical protein